MAREPPGEGDRPSALTLRAGRGVPLKEVAAQGDYGYPEGPVVEAGGKRFELVVDAKAVERAV